MMQDRAEVGSRVVLLRDLFLLDISNTVLADLQRKLR